MAIEEGGMFRCDRSPQAHKDGKPHNEFLNPTDKRRSDWLEVSWEDVMGAPNAERNTKPLDRSSARRCRTTCTSDSKG